MIPQVTTKAFSLLDEFKAFALKGNVIDLAIGIIIGGAFTKIVDSLVRHILMPLISTVAPAQGGYTEWAPVVNGTPVPVGLFLAEVVNFLIVALVLFFFVVKFLGWIARLRRKEEEVRQELPPLSKEQELLTEIRDLLRNGHDRGLRSGMEGPKG